MSIPLKYRGLHLSPPVGDERSVLVEDRGNTDIDFELQALHMSLNSEPSESDESLRQTLQRTDKRSKEGYQNASKFKPRPSDVFVAGPVKCGTTWLQQILHQLKSGGDMDFCEIIYVVPIIETAHALKIDLEEQRYVPRCYKSHRFYDKCPKGGKYIVLYREPCAVAFSSYNFYKGWLFDPEKVSLHKFIMEYFLDPDLQYAYTSYHKHLVSWWRERRDPNIMFLFYEEMKEDHEKCVRAIARFMDIDNEEKIKIAIQYSTFEFMKKNVHKFDAKYFHPGADENEIFHPKVATGSVDKALSVLDEKDKKAIQERWDEIVAKKTGYATYEQFKIGLRKEKSLVF